MKKEFEVFRSNLYAFILLFLSLFFLTIAIISFIFWIEWSLFIIIVSFILFVLGLLCFVLLYTKQALAFTITKKQIVFFEKTEEIYVLEDVEQVNVSANSFILTLAVKTNGVDKKYSYFVSKAKNVCKVTTDILNELEIKTEL
jgi:alpha-N-acetylglucosamine transferase